MLSFKPLSFHPQVEHGIHKHYSTLNLLKRWALHSTSILAERYTQFGSQFTSDRGNNIFAMGQRVLGHGNSLGNHKIGTP
jgi:hypothetical protein